ncbi:glycosyltransferase [Pseudomonas asiatica]|uniref:glycosyltransferase n=1 Tax=Pseudomonas asiatica TaxID=2219225 RepID=UPI001F1E3148|nr:glycosyltransferase [Pseudomonas asiatica]
MSKRPEFAYFSQSDLWDRDAVSEQLAVAEDLIELIPDGVTSILDAGCGNGTVTNKLAKHWDVVGCDLSESAVRHVKAPALVADLSCIPFADSHFDMVLSSDVIEHLPDAIYAQALSEMARVSSRYILIAVPYRETLQAAEVHCPKCGTDYHAHLHQRSYTLEDAISLFGETFTPVAVCFSGETWTFEDPKLVEAAHSVSGLDYPFEDGVCPVCSARRGNVLQAESAKRIKKRFESLQAMQVAEGLREAPPSSEILVLFERGAAAVSEWQLPPATAVFDAPHISYSSLVVRENPVNYPRSPYRISDASGLGIVVIPRRPKTIEATQGTFESLEVYDHVRGHYVACKRADEKALFSIAAVPFGPHGCIIRIVNPSPDLEMLAAFEISDFVEISDSCMGDDPSMQQVRDQLIATQSLSERLEFKRSDLELKLQAKELEIKDYLQSIHDLNALANGLENTRAEIESSYSLLSQTAAEQEQAYAANCLKLDELTERNERLEESCAVLNGNLRQLQHEYAENHQAFQSLQERYEQLSQLTTSLENSRSELEERHGRSSMELAENLQHMEKLNNLANELEVQRAALERELRVKDDHLVAMGKVQADLRGTVNTLSSRLDESEGRLLDQQLLLARIDTLELDKAALSLEIESLQVDMQARTNELVEKNIQTEQLSELTSRLEENRQALEDKLQAFGDMIEVLSKEKADYHVLAKALAMQSPVDRFEGVLPKSVLVVSHMYPREYNKVGGIFVHEQVKALRALGIDARVVSGEPFWINTYNPKVVKRALDIYRKQPLGEWEEIEGVPVIRFPYIVSALLPFQAHAFTYSHGLMRHAEMLRKVFDFQLIHAHTAYTDGTASRKLASKFKVPLVITEHTGPFTTLTRTAYLRRTTQKSLNAADKVISVSTALLADIRKNVSLNPKVQTEVIPNLVDTDFFKAEPLPCDGLIHMLWVGHFVPVKRVPLLLEAFAIALESQPLLRLSLAGDGEGEDQARQLAAQLGISDYVTFLGRATREQVRGHYQNCHFLVISSETETFGVVAIEAMSCGRPVLSSNCGGPADVITHPNLGRVVDLTTEGMAEGMLAMAASLDSFDSQVIRKYSEMRFSAVSVAQSISSIYMELLRS